MRSVAIGDRECACCKPRSEVCIHLASPCEEQSALQLILAEALKHVARCCQMTLRKQSDAANSSGGKPIEPHWASALPRSPHGGARHRVKSECLSQMGCEQNARNPATSIQHQAWNADLNNQYSLAGAFFALRASELGTKDAECDHLASDVVRMILRLGPLDRKSVV